MHLGFGKSHRFFYKNLVDNGFKSTHTEPQKYNLMDSFTTYVSDTYGNDWDELDKFDEKTGLRGTANRSTEFKKWLNAEKNKLNSDISYRRKYSYKGTDSDVANWATRHNLTVQDINNILYALEDNTISDEENKTLPIGLNLNQFLSTGKDSEYHRNFIANQEAKAKQEKAKQEADWNRTNAFNINWLYSKGNNYGITPSYLTYKEKDYTDFTNLDPEAAEYLKTAKYNLHNQLSNNYNINSHKYRYAVDLTKFFDGNTFDLSGHQIIKAWDGDVSNVDSGSFYIYNPSGTYTPITIFKYGDDGRLYSSTPAGNVIDLGYLNEYLDMDPDKYYSNFVQNNPNHILANSNFTYSDTGQKDGKNHVLRVTNGYIVRDVTIPTGDYKDPSEIRQAIKNVLLGIPSAQKGAKFKQREIPKPVKQEEQGGVIRKYQNSGQFTTLTMPDPYKTKLYDPNVLNKFNNNATNWAESYLSSLNSNSTIPQLGLTKEESDKLLVGNTTPVINNYDPIKKAEAKGYAEGLASVIRNSTIDEKQVTRTPGKDKYTFNPDMPTAYSLASLATNIFGNIAQTRKLIDNYKPFTRQAAQLPHVPVTGDYISLQAGQTQAGNMRTVARNASQSTSDARLGIASELTGNTQATTLEMQATAADIAAKRQSEAASRDVTNKNLISAIDTANQNAFEYNKAHNYKTQLESQLIGLTAKNTDNFLKEMQMKSEQRDAMMKEAEYKRRATDLSKTFENDLTKYASDNYLAKAKQYLTSKGTDITGMSNSSILDEYFKNNTLAYEEYQNYVNSQKNLFNSQLNNLQLEIYKGKPLLTVEDFLNTDNHNNPIYGNPRRIFKKGGSVREKAVIQQIKDRNKDKLETKKSNAKSLRDSDSEFNKTYRHLSAGTLALLKKAME